MTALSKNFKPQPPPLPRLDANGNTIYGAGSRVEGRIACVTHNKDPKGQKYVIVGHGTSILELFDIPWLLWEKYRTALESGIDIEVWEEQIERWFD